MAKHIGNSSWTPSEKWKSAISTPKLGDEHPAIFVWEQTLPRRDVGGRDIKWVSDRDTYILCTHVIIVNSF